MTDTSSRIRVKFVNKNPLGLWGKLYFPNSIPSWGNCDFIFDWEATEYDWLVVYDDLPPSKGERRAMREEILACPQKNTLLLTTEPQTIKVYGKGITQQYGWVLTGQEEWALPHPHRIFRPQAMHRLYGLDMSDKGNDLTFDNLIDNPPIQKIKDFSTVCSVKQQKYTLHDKRYQFTQKLKEFIPSMDIYGRGVRFMNDKAEALDDYRYHLAIENFIGPNYFTEKLTDVYLGGALPFYCGCPNVSDYFPEQSVILLDIENVGGAKEIIERAIRDNEYEKRLPAILEARRLSLYDNSLFGIVSKEVESRNTKGEPAGDSICSRWLYLKKHPLRALQFILEKRRLGSF